MEYLVCLIIVCVVIFLVKKISSLREEYTEEKNNFSDTSSFAVKTSGNEYPVTTNIVLSALQALGCQPEFKEDNTLVVSYQGETFQFDFGEAPSRYTRIWDPC